MPHPLNPPTRYPAAWHALEEATERAWLDQWARAELIPQQPWARPDWDVMADMNAYLTDTRTTAGSPR
jgi:hypothetical protein